MKELILFTEELTANELLIYLGIYIITISILASILDQIIKLLFNIFKGKKWKKIY